MARQPTPAPVVQASTINEVALQEGSTGLNELAVLQTERRQNVQDLATRMGYDGPLTADAVENCISLYRQRSAEAILGLGKALLLLKEMVPHSEFQERLVRQTVEYRTANRLMNVALKFGKSDNLSLLKAAGNQAKLLELTVLEDSEIAELEAGETVRGLDLDDIQRMGFAELRKQLREVRDSLEDQKKLSSKKSDRIASLQEAVDRISVLKPDEDLADLQTKATKKMHGALAAVKGELRQALLALKEYDAADQSLFMAGLVGQVQADLAALREEFNLPDTSTAADQQLLAEMNQWAAPGHD